MGGDYELKDCPECRLCCGNSDRSILLVSKYNANGNKIWEKLYQPFSKEIECRNLQVISIGIDKAGNLDVYGKATINYSDESKGIKFILKYDSNGDVVEENFSNSLITYSTI